MKHMKKLIVAFLTLTVAFSPCVATVQAAPEVPKSKIFYLYPKGDPMNSSIFFLSISGVLNSKDVTNIKSSNPKVIPNDMEMGSDGLLRFHAKKAGKATISFKIKGKAYRTKITLKKYVNPVKHISITGVKNKGKTNLANLSDKKIRIDLKTSKPKVVPTAKISAKKGWKIHSISKYLGLVKKYKKPVANSTFKVPRGFDYLWEFNVTFINVKNKESIVISYSIN